MQKVNEFNFEQRPLLTMFIYFAFTCKGAKYNTSLYVKRKLEKLKNRKHKFILV